MSALLSLYTPPPPSRPRPIHDSASGWMRWWGFIGSVIIAAVGYGIISTTTGDALEGLLGTIPGVVNAVATLLTALGIVRQAEPHTTPLRDPRGRDGRHLRPVEAGVGETSPTTPRPADRDRADRADDDGWWDADDPQRGRGPVAYLSPVPEQDDRDHLTDHDEDDRELTVRDGDDRDIRHHQADTRGWTATPIYDQVSNTAESVPTGRDGYTPPESFPVADSAGHGSHSSSDSGSGSSGGDS